MLAGVGLFKLVQSDSDPTEVSSPPKTALNAIPLTTLEGLESTLEDWRGEILVVNFWAPWCLPCRREIPTLIELQTTHAEDQVKVLGIALDGYQSVKDFAQEHQINYPLFLVGNRTSMYKTPAEACRSPRFWTVISRYVLNTMAKSAQNNWRSSWRRCCAESKFSRTTPPILILQPDRNKL